MQRLYFGRLIGLALTGAVALAGCSDDTEETPDITEAIPLTEAEDGDVDVDGAPDAAGEQANGEDSRTEGEASALPNAPSSGDAKSTSSNIGQRPIPDTMEAGSNPPDFSGPPKGSKVQRFN